MSEEQSIPQQLRQTREEQQKSLEDVRRRTGLSLNVLHNLEAGNFEVIEPVFIRMALRTYAEDLGLDATGLLREYDRTWGHTPTPTPEPEPPSPPQPAFERPFDVSGIPLWVRLIILAIAGLIIVFLLIALFGGESPEGDSAVPEKPPRSARAEKPYRTPAPAPVRELAPVSGTAAAPEKPGQPASEPPAPPPATPSAAEPLAVAAPAIEEPPVEPVIEELPVEPDAGEPATAPTVEAPPPMPVVEVPLAAPAVEPTVEVPPVTPTAEEPPAAPVVEAPSLGPVPPERAAAVEEEAVDTLLVLEIEAVDSTWVQIRGDNRNLFEGIAAPGVRHRWEVRDHFLVRSGRAHGLRYWFQGELLGEGRLGDPLKVLRFRASRAGVTLLGADLEPLPPAPSLTPTP